MNSKVYTLPNGKKAVFEYDICGIGKVTLECMDELMNMIADRPRAEWIAKTENFHSHWCCSSCGAWALLEYDEQMCLSKYCPSCGARMKGADDE